LQASDIAVGLPWHETGNSEVGHLTIGAGKVVYQYYPKITMAIQDKSFFSNAALKESFAHAKEHGGSVNLVGLLTGASTHAALDHIKALMEMGVKEGVQVNLHLFGDAIDGTPRTLEQLLGQIPDALQHLGTLTGRYYAMDRTENWQLVERTYKTLIGADGTQVPAEKLHDAIEEHYAKNLTEEFLPPIIIDKAKCVKANDSVIFFNFREDSIRELSDVFIEKDFSEFTRTLPENLHIVTMTKYRDGSAAAVAFPADAVLNPLGKVISDAGKNQLRIAESYKYAHITYFFNGHVEEPFKNEYRILIPSLKGTHPDEHPELMAAAVTERLVESINDRSFDFVLVNYSNPDTIAHTGNYDASVAAAKVIDEQIAKVIEAAKQTDAIVIITSDHGHLDELLDPQTGRAITGHNPNPVPFYLIAKEYAGKHFAGWPNLKQQTTGILADVAPTVLALMGLQVPQEMTGRNLLNDIL
jgi:2,3-bisphosphoglycerate-independent phosphoglycerate mutase